MDTERSLTTPVDPRIRMQKEGLYDPSFQHASCGVGFVVNVDGRRTHQIVPHGITIRENLVHRRAVGGDSRTGDGAGMLTQVPYRFFTREASRLGFSLPAKGPESFLLRGQVVARDGEDEENLVDAADEEGRGGRSGDIGLEAAARRTLRTRAL